MSEAKKPEELKEVPAIEKMAGASFPVLEVPFNGVPVMVKVRCLNRTQLRALGEFNLIDIRKDKEKDNEEGVPLSDVIGLINWQEALVKETLIEPTFQEIQDRVYGQDMRIEELKKKAQVIEDKLPQVEASERVKFEKELNSLNLYIGALLPNDFMNAITEWATGVNRSDIKKVTREMLLEAAILAKNGNDNPADHMAGEFLELHKDEINKSAWFVFNEYMADKEAEKKARTIQGGRVKG